MGGGTPARSSRGEVPLAGGTPPVRGVLQGDKRILSRSFKYIQIVKKFVWAVVNLEQPSEFCIRQSVSIDATVLGVVSKNIESFRSSLLTEDVLKVQLLIARN